MTMQKHLATRLAIIKKIEGMAKVGHGDALVAWALLQLALAADRNATTFDDVRHALDVISSSANRGVFGVFRNPNA